MSQRVLGREEAWAGARWDSCLWGQLAGGRRSWWQGPISARWSRRRLSFNPSLQGTFLSIPPRTTGRWRSIDILQRLTNPLASALT
jgi:hypothetical protein